jgi:phthalate 4,5-dioxygenase oxygenase subunit
MLTAEENELLCRVENGAPMGEMMRRHWVPACLSEEIAEKDGAPVRVRLFGENLVAFRDTNGRVGLIDEHCPHRRASLVFGRNEECGLRCLYHGWKFDVEGRAVDMPSEPAGSKLPERVRIKAYPTREAGGFVWAYMGPAELMPEFSPPPWARDGLRVAIAKMHENANWAQALEGAIDSAHSSTLHSSNIRPGAGERTTTPDGTLLTLTRPSNDKAPRIQVQPTGYGFRYAAIRKPIERADTHQYVRVSVFIAPFIVLIPPNALYSIAQVFVPMDDTNTMFYFLSFGENEIVETDAWRRRLGASVGVDLDDQYRKLRTVDNRFKQDRAAMKQGDFTGIYGIPNQDMAMQETMGPIADRTKEILSASDVAIVRFRQLMIEAVRRFQAGEAALGTEEPRLPIGEIKAFEGIVSKEVAWRSLGVSEREMAGYRELQSNFRATAPVSKTA